MSRFFSAKYSALEPYVPGEQPKERRYIKLNTNESPFPPSPLAARLAREAAGDLQLYSDPECSTLVQIAAAEFGVGTDEILFTNGSDELLNFAFMAFCDAGHPAVFPDISYGFYPVFARLNGIPYREIPLQEDFTVRVEDYLQAGGMIVLANPNAPTGIALPLSEIERIVAANPENVVVVDEAYVDFGGESAIPLIHRYDNLLVCRTFSKSYSLAGGRLGFGVGCPALIADLRTLKYSTNPYNVNRMTMAAGIGALLDRYYFTRNCAAIQRTRETTAAALRQMGFTVLPSKANFLFIRSDAVSGERLYTVLREKDILVRHFRKPRLEEFNRVTIGSDEEMTAFLQATKEILEENG